MDKYEEKSISDIEKHGCHILSVIEDDEGLTFSYSIGIEESNSHPEIIITGLPSDFAQLLINDYNARVKDGEVFEVDKMYDGFLEGFEVTFKLVEKKHYKEYFGWAQWLYKDKPYRVLQLIYPNTSGVWVWDKEADDDLKWFIPRLYAH